MFSETFILVTSLVLAADQMDAGGKYKRLETRIAHKKVNSTWSCWMLTLSREVLDVCSGGWERNRRRI